MDESGGQFALMQQVVCAPFGRLDPFNLGGIATLTMFPYHAFGGLGSALLHLRCCLNRLRGHENNTPTSVRMSSAVISQTGPVGSRYGPGGAASPDTTD